MARRNNFCIFLLTPPRRSVNCAAHAGIAQLVEHDLAKVGVASSSLVSRSRYSETSVRRGFVFSGLRNVRSALRFGHRPGGRVVMQRPAKPCTPVRFRPRPPHRQRFDSWRKPCRNAGFLVVRGFCTCSAPANCAHARVAKLVYARDLKSLDRKVMRVRPPPRAPRRD